MSDLQLPNQIAFVTGAGSGIGAACARLLSERGATVVAADLDLDKATSVAAEVGGHAVELDVANHADVEQAVARTEVEVGPIDVLVNNAGITLPARPPEEVDMAAWDRVFDVDVKGVWFCSVSAGSRMAARGRGSIVNIASIAGMRSTPLHAYGPAKAGVILMTSNLAVEWGRSGVRVNAISPGWTLTPLFESKYDQARRDIMAQDAALERLVQPDEIARAVAFLASDEASAITGINLPVDAGWLALSGWSSFGVTPRASGQEAHGS